MRKSWSRRITTRRPQALATALAEFARRLRAQIQVDLAGEGTTRLAALYEQARAEITPELGRDDFADLLAQALIYALLLVRHISQEQDESFAGALDAFLKLPGLPPFARALLLTLWSDAACASGDLAGCVKELVAFLMATDLRVLLETLRPLCLQSDPLIYFYEIFLTAYAPRQRSQRGVYYTPAPVIAYMVRVLDELLSGPFAYPGGLAGALQEECSGDGIFVCDPACGIGAFLWAVLDHARETYRVAGRAEDWRRDLLACIQPRLIGCEITPSAYLLACIELATRQAALDLPVSERSAWALPDASHWPAVLPCISLANTLNNEHPLMLPASGLPIVLGNPPYAGHSLNHSAWLGHLLESYKTGDAGLKKPAQAKWLSDDYVQFLRLAQWQIERAGRGIVAFLTNHSYLDNPTFRGMRRSLLRSFDEIYILDLHGNSKRREQAPDGECDRNIFTIQQGVAIGIFVKYGRSQAALPPAGHEERLAAVRHADVWGVRAVYEVDSTGARQLSGGKLGWLTNHTLGNTPWQTSQPVAPFYIFTPRDASLQDEYMAGWSLPAIFALNGDPAPGLLTCHDDFAIAWSAEEMATKIAALLESKSEAEARRHFRLCGQRQWDYVTARRVLATDLWRNALGSVLYRPFDTRWTVFERHVAVHLRERVTRHMRAGPNLALAVGRAGQVVHGGATWDVAFCTRLPTEFNLYRRGGNYLFPLYLYPAGGAPRVANLAPPFITEVSQRLTLRWQPDGSGDLYATFGPDDIFAYIYALLYAPGYRARYADFLKIDFPRIPLPGSADLFRVLCQLGRALSQTHLLERPLLLETLWTETSETQVESVQYLPDVYSQGRVFINAHCCLEHVPEAAWLFTIGGYQVAKRWLMDRRGRQLSPVELEYYRQVIAGLVETLKFMAAIDRVLEGHGGWPHWSHRAILAW